MRRLALTAWLILAALPTVAVELPDARPVAYIPPDAERIVLTNGAVVYLREDHELPLFDLKIWFRISPADRDPTFVFGALGDVWRSGGTKRLKPDALDEKLESMAINIETDADYESASVSVSCLSRNMDQALDLWAEVMFQPAFDARKLAISKGQTLEALRRKNETPAQIARRAFRDVIYGPDHVYADDPQPADIERINRGHLAAAHRRILAPQTAIIAASGDFDRKKLIEGLERRFANWKRNERKDPPFDYSVSSAPAAGLYLVEKDFSQSRVSIGRIGIDRHSPDRYACTVADYIFGGGGGSRLFAEIRSRRGLAYVVGSFLQPTTGPGMIGAISQTKAEATPAVVGAILGEMKRMATSPVSSDELELAKAAIVNSLVFDYDTPFDIASAHAMREFFDYAPDELKTKSRKILAITREDVLAVAKKYYDPQGVKILVVGDPKKFDGPLDQLGTVTRIPLESIE